MSGLCEARRACEASLDLAEHCSTSLARWLDLRFVHETLKECSCLEDRKL